MDELDAIFAASDRKRGTFVECFFDPACESLHTVREHLKRLRITVRCSIQGPAAVSGFCLFSGVPTQARVILARAY